MWRIVCVSLVLICLALHPVLGAFSIFASGISDYLGVGSGETDTKYLHKVLIPPTISSNEVLYLFDSSQDHTIVSTQKMTQNIGGLTTKSFHALHWGQNSKQIMSYDAPHELIYTPTLINLPEDTANISAVAIEEYTFIINSGERIYTLGFPKVASDIFKTSLISDQMSYREWKNPGGRRIRRVHQTNNRLSTILELEDDSFLTFGMQMGMDGLFSKKDYNNFRIEKTKAFSKVLKITGSVGIFRVLDERGFIMTWGGDFTAKILGVIREDPLSFSIDNTDWRNPKVTNENPRKIYSPVQLHFEINSNYYARFRNIWSGEEATIALSMDGKTLIGWGRNPCNMLGVENYNSSEPFVFPPRVVTEFPSLDDIKQISVGKRHTLILKKDNTIWGIGDNAKGELGGFVGTSSTKIVQLRFLTQDDCVSNGNCTTEFIFAGDSATFIGLSETKKGEESSIQMQPMCFGLSHLDLGVCSSNGMCIENDNCSCFLGFVGKRCETPLSCFDVSNCTQRGICSGTNQCTCFEYATGPDCSVPICGNFAAGDPRACSGNGQCGFSKDHYHVTECACQNGWSGKYCGNHPEKSPVLYAAGQNSFGETATGLKDPFVVNFTKVSFALSEYNEKYRLRELVTGFSHSTFIYGDQIHVTSRYTKLFGVAPTVGCSEEGWYWVPHPVPNSFFPVDEHHGVKRAVSSICSGALMRDGKVFVLQYVGDSDLSTKPTPLPQAENSDKLYYLHRGMAFLKNNQIYVHGNNRYDELGKDLPNESKIFDPWSHVQLPSSEPVAKCCRFSFGTMCLTTKGTVYRWGPYYDFVNDFFHPAFKVPTLVNTPFLPVYDIKCGLYVAAFQNEEGTWYTQYAPTTNPVASVGHDAVDGSIAVAKNYYLPGKELLDFSVGDYHAILLMKDKTTEKKEVYMIGDNRYKAFGFETDFNVTKIPVKVKFPEGFPTDAIKNVQAVQKNSFIGAWEDAIQDYSWCNGIPEYLEFVCGGRGTCVNGTCICKEAYINWNTIDRNSFMVRMYFFFGGVEHEANTCVDDFETSRWVKIVIDISIIALLLSLSVCCFCVLVVCVFCGLFWPAVLLVCCPLLLGPVYFRLKWKRTKNKFIHTILEEINNDDEMSDLDSCASTESQLGMIDSSMFNLNFSDFTDLKQISGGGSKALCFEAFDKKNEEKVFLKLFYLEKSGKKFENAQFKNEIQILARVRHTNVVNFCGVFFAPPSKAGYVTEFCQEGSLQQFISNLSVNSKKKGEFGIFKKLDWILQISRGMRFLHQKNVIFRDLKPSNILIGQNQVLKITDFGTARLVDAQSGLLQVSKDSESVGTPMYLAPEVTLRKDLDLSVDVFSFGIVMFQILAEAPDPFEFTDGYGNAKFGIEKAMCENPTFRPNTNRIAQILKHDKSGIPQELIDEVSKILINLMGRCWDEVPAKRPTFREIVRILSEAEDKLETA